MKHHARPLATVFASMFLVILAAAPAAADEAAPAGAVERTLPSGAEAVLWPQPGSGTVLVAVAVPAGSQDEPDGNGGLSHYLEHLLFDGFDELDERGVTEGFERLSAYMNAFTREQATVFFALVPDDSALAAAELMVGMLTRSTIGAEVYEKEKKVILEELAKDHASPAGLREEALRAALWAGTPLAHPVGGTRESVGATDREAVVEYWQRHYRPDGFRVLITGDRPLDGLAAVLAPFAELQPGGPPPARADQLSWSGWGEWVAAQAPAAAQQVGVPAMGMASAHGRPGDGGAPSAGTLAVVVAAPDGLATAGTELEVVARWLASAEGPLVSALVPEWAGEVSVMRQPRQPRDLLEVRVEGAVGVDPTALLARTLGVLQGSAAGPGDADARTIQRRWAAERALNDQRLHYAAVFYGEAMAAARGGLADSLLPPVVPADEVRRAARLLLTDTMARTRAAWLGDGGPDRRLRLPETVVAEAQPLKIELEAGPLGSRVVALDNGVVVGVLPEVGSAVFGIHLLVADRALAEPPGLAGVADLIHRLLPGGTVMGGSSEVADRVARAGFEIKPADSPAIPFDDRYHVADFSYVRIEGPADELETALSMLSEMIRVAAWDDDGWRSAASDHGAARVADNSGGERAEQLFLEALLGAGHPLARPVAGDAGGRMFTADEVEAVWGAWPAGYFSPDRLILTVASPLPVEQTVAVVADLFSGGPEAVPRRGPYPEPEPSTERITVIGADDAPQVTLLWGRAVEVAPADRAAVLVAMDALSDRMTAVIREREGLAYRLGASVRHLPNGQWVVAARVGTRPENSDRVAELLTEIVAELQHEAMARDDLERLAARRQRTEMLRTLSAASRAYRVGRALFEGPGSPLAVDEAALEAVSPEDVVEAAERYLIIDDMMLVVAP